MKKILLSSVAQKQYSSLDKNMRELIKEKLMMLARKQKSIFDVKKLKGIKGRESLWRLRVGNYRIIYADTKEALKVIQIIPRSKGYSWL
jgi:mRNA interferase RelE/StbE